MGHAQIKTATVFLFVIPAGVSLEFTSIKI